MSKVQPYTEHEEFVIANATRYHAMFGFRDRRHYATLEEALDDIPAAGKGAALYAVSDLHGVEVGVVMNAYRPGKGWARHV